MLKWFGSDDAGSSPGAGEGAVKPSFSEETERLAQMEQLVSQLKEMIREKDAALHTKDEQLKAEKEACDAKLSKIRLQNKAKVTSLNSQLEELRKKQGEPPQFKRSGSGESGESEHTGASRGKILLLKKKVEDLEQQLAQRNQELNLKTKELESQRERGAEMDAMLVEKDKRLAEKEDYIIHLQMGLGGEKSDKTVEQTAPENKEAALQELEMLVQNLTKKVGDGEEKYSLLKEQNDSFRELLVTERAQFEEKENMYKQNIQTFKDIILQKDNRLTEMSQLHEQELFKLAAKSDASADLEQLLKALKQKLHEKEEVLLGKTQVIDVLQGEVDGRDQQIQDLNERLRRLQSEKENLQSKMDAEKHIMRTQVRDLMQKHQEELKKVTEKYEQEMSEKQMMTMSSASVTTSADLPVDPSMNQKLSDLEARVKLKAEEASKSEAKFLKMKALSKSRIRQLEDELKKAQCENAAPDVAALRAHVSELEEEREELLCKLEQYDELQAKNDVLEAKLVVYEEQQRKMQADLEQVTKRAASQLTDTGSVLLSDDGFLNNKAKFTCLQSLYYDLATKKKWDMDRTEENKQEYKELQRRVKREVSKAKQKAYDELYTRLDTREGEKDLYRLARQRDRDGKDVQQVRAIKDRDGRVLTSEESVQRRWKEYFEELMNEENEREKRVEGVNSVEQEVDKIRKDEVRKALKRMKSGKAVGPDDIPVEVWKCLGEAAVEFLASLFNRVLESERMPEEWRRSVLVPIFKNKGDVQSCSNYRGIKLMSHTMKLWERVVEARLRKVVEICEQQYGFMPRKSTTDAIFALRILMEKYRDGQRELHCVFVDLEKAYDRVPREELWYCMRKSGVAEKYVRVVQDMYERSRTVVRCAVGQTEEFKVEVGLHQGSALSPFLFAIVMDQLSEEVRQESPWTMMFADDIVICSESREQVEENLERWRFALERRGMKVSGSKTEYMCVNEREGSGTVRLQGEEVKKVQEFKYLGSTVQSNGECGKEASESGSMDDAQSQVMEWQDMMTMVADAEAARNQIREEKNVLEIRMSHIEEEREALANRQRELEEELAQARGLRPQKGKKMGISSPRNLQEDFEFNNRSPFSESHIPSGNITPMEGENMGGWWPEFTASNTGHECIVILFMFTSDVLEGLRSVVEELELERNQLQEQILGLEERCQDLEDRLQLQARIESLQVTFDVDEEGQPFWVSQNESEKLQAQLSSLRSQQSRDAEKHQLLVTSLNEQLKGLSSTQECLESSLMEKEHTLAQTSEKLELIDSLRDALKEKEEQHKDVVDKLLQTENNLSEVTKKCSTFEKQCTEMKETVAELMQKLNVLKEKTQRQEATIESLQSDLDQTTDELDRLNTTHLEERAQLIHDLQSCERELDSLKDIIADKDKEISALSGNMEARIIRESQSSDQHSLNMKIAELTEQLGVTENDLSFARKEKEAKMNEMKELLSQLEENKLKIQDLNMEIQKLNTNSEGVLAQLKETRNSNEKLKEQILDREQTHEEEMKTLKEERNKLLADVTKYNNELQSLSSQLQAQVECQEQVKLGVEEKLVTIISLEEKLRKSRVEDLTKENHALKQEVENKVQLLQQVSEEKVVLLRKTEELESQQVEKGKMVEDLIKDKEKLNDKATELEQSKQSLTEHLLEKTENERALEECTQLCQSLQEQNTALSDKTHECQSHLNELDKRNASLSSLSSQLGTMNELNAKLEAENGDMKKSLEEFLASNKNLTEEITLRQANIIELHNNIQALSTQNLQIRALYENKEKELAELGQVVSEMDKKLQESKESINHLNEQLKMSDSQFNISFAEKDQEQGSALKSGLLEKDAVLQQQSKECSSLQSELNHQRELSTNLQTENEKLKGECSQLLQDLRAKEKSHLAESATLKEELSLKQVELVKLQDNNQLSNRDASFTCLTQQLATEHSKAESLHLELQQKEESFKQQETFLSQLQRDAQNLQRSLQEKDVLLLKKDQELTQLHEKITAEIEARIKSDMDVISKLQGDLQNEAEKQLSMKANTAKLENTISQLTKLSSLNKTMKGKDLENDNLRLELSQLNELVSVLNINLSDQAEAVSRLKAALDESTSTVVDQTKALQDLQQKAEEADLLKSQFVESTELVSELQSQTQALKQESSRLSIAIDEKQSALTNLQDKFAFQVEELQEAKNLLSQKNKELSNLNRTISERDGQIHALQQESSSLQNEVKQLRLFNVEVLKQKDDALVSQQMNTNALTIEIERLKEQHLQVATQVKHTEHAMSEMQKMNELCKKLQEENRLTKQELDQVNSERTKKEEEVHELVLEKDAFSRNYSYEIQRTQEQLQLQSQQQHSSMERMKTEMEQLQVQDLDHLNEKLAEATLAIEQGSERLKEKELDALMSRSKLEEIASTVQAKDRENIELRQALHDKQIELKKFLESQEYAQNELQEDNQSRESFFKKELAELNRELEQSHVEGLDNKSENEGKIALLSENDELTFITIQISQQKELLTALSQQLKVKDTSITQVVASASNERIKHEEQNEKLKLVAKLEQLERDVSTTDKDAGSERSHHTEELESELAKANFTSLQEKHNQQTQEFMAVKSGYDLKVQELECALQNLKCLQGKEQSKEIAEQRSELAKEITEKNDDIAKQKAYIQTTEQQLKDLQQIMTKLQSDQLQCLKQKLEKVTYEMAHKDELLLKLEEQSKEMVEKSAFERSQLVKEIHEKNQEIERQHFYIQTAEGQLEQFKEDMTKLQSELQNQLASSEELKLAVKAAEESVVSDLRRQKNELERNFSKLSAEKQNLGRDVDRILSDNHNLSAACESLKLTIENITQQKQAFSCQLESLKDSQTEELSEWKSKHADLKQEYESLLQAYENVSSEMDKMRQLLEGAKRERQEALVKSHKYESERDILDKQIAELEEENDKMKEKMRKFAKVKQQKIEELEAENEKIRKDLLSFDDKQKCMVDELTLRNGRLESEIKSFQESSEELRGQMCKLQQENQILAKELKETSLSLEKWHKESESTESSLQAENDHKRETSERDKILSDLKQLMEVKEDKAKVCQEKEQLHLRLVKEFEEKLKVLQRGTEERSLKHSEAQQQQVQKQLREMTEKVTDLQKENGSLEKELKTHKNLLNETRKELSRVTSEKGTLEQKLAEGQERSEFESAEKERSLEKMVEQQQALLKEQRSELQKQINDLQEQNNREAQVIMSLHKQVESKDLQLKTLQREAETNSAKLAVMSVDPNIGNAAEQWDNVFQKVLHDKDSQLLEQSLVITQLSEDNGEKDRVLNDMQITNRKLERSLNEYSVAAAAHQRQLFSKDTEISSLLSSKDGQLSGYLEQLQANHHAQLAGYEDRLTALYTKQESSEKEAKALESKVRSLQIKERGKEESAESVTKSLKQEIRTLLHQMDDLNSENAMLKAQLIRYREDLNQVLSLKDNQLKDLLKKQQDSIRNLENQKRTAEMHHRDALLKKERRETNESKVIADLQQAIAAKASECNELQQKLFAQKVAADDLNRSLKETVKESERQLTEAEDKYNQELNAFEREFNLMRNERETADQRVADLARELMQAEQDLLEAKSQNKNLKSQNESLGKAMAALQNDRDQLIDEFKILRSRYDKELREATASMNKFEHQLNDSTSEISALATEKNILVQKLLALESKDPHSKLSALVNDLSQAVSEKEAQLKQASLEKSSFSRQVNSFSKAMVSLQSDRDRLMEELRKAKKEVEYRQQASAEPLKSVKSEDSNNLSVSVGALQTERDGLHKEVGNVRSQNAELVDLKQKYDDQQRALQQAHAYKQQCEKDVLGYQAELAELRSEKSRLLSECQALREFSKESGFVSGKGTSTEQVAQLQTHLQRCLVEIQQRDIGFQQLNIKLQQAVEEKSAVSAQLRTVSQTLRETQLSLSELQNRYYWIANQQQIQHSPAQGSVCAEVAPGAPQEISSAASDLDGLDIRELKSRLAEAELQLDSTQQNVSLLNDRLEEERVWRQAAEEALGLAEQRCKSMEPSPSRSSQRDFSIQLDTEEEWESLILDPKQHVLMRTMKSGVHSCRRWMRGRNLYCSKMLTSRAKSRYFFLLYLLALHILVFMCFTGVL
ncbi:hypothetical protein QTP70_018467 [Hemibagrus guttatus]|uniref:ribonuclease H n=2 Tax=Hemibagrus guttatus TaxID=175788 RepID=A0AAE0RAA0_9TELE|nr:hypothetical protein QTP70_018467 [Hemibagrus guttatus]